jgi:anthranilate synthase component 1
MMRTLADEIAPSRAQHRAYDGDAEVALLSLSLLADTETPISTFARLGGGGGEPCFLLESVEGGERMARYSFLATRVGRSLRVDGDEAVVRDLDGAVATPLPVAAVAAAAPAARAAAQAALQAAVLDAVRAFAPQRSVWSPRPLPRFCAGAVGVFAFDCVRYFERIALAAAPADAQDGAHVPDIALLLPDVLVAYDHVERRILLTTTATLHGDASARATAWDEAAARLCDTVVALHRGAPPEPWPIAGDPERDAPTMSSSQTPDEFMQKVATAKAAIAAGEVFQVVLSQRFDVAASTAPLQLYRALRAINPSPYMFLLDLGDVALIGASPEVLVRVEEGEVLLRPIAGTRRRGRDDTEDEALAADLLADPKELAEHHMLLDLGRNDVGRVAEPGSVRVLDPLHIERYSHVIHLVSDVRGRLRAGADALDALAAAFPAGTVSGAPKVRALELIGQLEPTRRGAYAGAVGYLDIRGNLDTALAIRTMVAGGGVVSVQAGAGIVHDSVPAHEHAECEAKARAALAAIAFAAAHEVA